MIKRANVNYCKNLLKKYTEDTESKAIKHLLKQSKHYEDLAGIIAQYSPELWNKMGVKFEQFDMPGEFGLDSWASVGKKRVPVDFSEEDIDKLEKIFKAIKKQSKDKWRTAQFEFNNDGNYEMNFKY